MINPIQKIRDQYYATVTELKKCSWPTWRELGESTLVVIITGALLSVFIFVVDFLVTAVVTWLS